MKLRCVFLLACLLATQAIAAVPTVHEVYRAAQAGHLTQAHQMMQTVINANPQSAKAYFVDAEILASMGDISAARKQLEKSRALDPSMSFANPKAIAHLNQKIDGGDSLPVARDERTTSPSLWWLLPVALIVWLLYRAYRRSKMPVYPAAQMPPQYAASSGVGGVPPSPMQTSAGGMGSGIAQSLVTGAALGAGLVAGQALANRFMHGGSNEHIASQDNPTVADSDLGGADFGLDDSSNWNDGGGGEVASADIGSDDSW